ncbi:hypothetical protein LguiA_016255 [Lonicera macranthoides]
MALVFSVNNTAFPHKPFLPRTNPNNSISPKSSFITQIHNSPLCFSTKRKFRQRRMLFSVVHGLDKDSDQSTASVQDGEVYNVGVKAALSMLKFYKREISPVLPNSCRYVPTCSEYSMIAYKKYGVVKGTILTAYRLCRCNPLGGSGFDPPRWFDETTTPPDQ